MLNGGGACLWPHSTAGCKGPEQATGMHSKPLPPMRCRQLASDHLWCGDHLTGAARSDGSGVLQRPQGTSAWRQGQEAERSCEQSTQHKSSCRRQWTRGFVIAVVPVTSIFVSGPNLLSVKRAWMSMHNRARTFCCPLPARPLPQG